MFTVLAFNKPASSSSFTWVARSRSESTSQFTASALNKLSSSSSSSSSSYEKKTFNGHGEVGLSGRIGSVVALGWTRGRRDSTHGTWVSRHALSWRRARRCRCTAAGKLEHVRRAQRRRRDGAVGGAAAAGARAARARRPPGGGGRASAAVRACIGLVLPGRWRSVARVGLQAHVLRACVAAGDGRTGTKRPATGAAGQSMPPSEAVKDGRALEWVTPRGVVPTQCQDGRALERVTPRGVVPTQCLVPESTE